MEYTNNIIHEEHKQEFFVANGVRNDSFVKESNGKIGVLSFLFSIFYPIGYFYKQWKAIKKNNEEYKNISPFWRGVFYPFYAFQFTKILDNLLSIKKNKDFSNATNEEEKKKLENEYAVFNKFYSNSYIIAIVPILAVVLIFCNFIPESFNTGIGVAVWISISMTLRNLQKAIDKILPQDHPKGKLTFSDFLGLPFLVLFLSFFFFEIGGQRCLEIKGNTLEDTCNNYSFTFPYGGNKLFAENDDLACQAKNNNNIYNDVTCLKGMYIDDNDSFDQKFCEEDLGEESDIMFKETKTYNGNLAYCFNIKLKNDPAAPNQNICYMQIKDKPKIVIIVWTPSKDREISFENLEKLMNSYKSW